MENIRKAVEICTKDLRKCYSNNGIFAGLTHFSDYWARDFCYASYGSLKLKDYDIVKKGLQLFFDRQREDGLLALRVGERNMILKLLGFKSNNLTPIFSEDKLGNISVDQNSLLIIMLAQYCKETKDVKFAKDYFEKAELAYKFLKLLTNDEAFLIQGAYCDWLDSIDRSPISLYANICFWKAIESLADLAKMIKVKRNYSSIAKKARLSILSSNISPNRLEADGVLLGLFWNFYTPTDAKILLSKIPNKITYPAYPEYSLDKVSMILKVGGMKDYHRKMHWLWISALRAVAIKKYLGVKQSKEYNNYLANLVNKYGTVYEVYDEFDIPIKKLFYKSEVPFAWSLGLLICAMKK